MSPRAAWRLETLGFSEVYEYTAGEMDWFAYGLAMEGANAAIARVGDLARTDIPRCSLEERVGDVWERAQASGWDRCAVVNGNDVILGLVRPQELAGDQDSTVEAVMRSGPATYRPDVTVTDATQQMRKRGVSGVLIARTDGTLIGWLRRDDAERVVAEATTTD